MPRYGKVDNPAPKVDPQLSRVGPPEADDNDQPRLSDESLEHTILLDVSVKNWSGPPWNMVLASLGMM